MDRIYNIAHKELQKIKEKKSYKKFKTKFNNFIQRCKRNDDLAHVSTVLTLLFVLFVAYYILNGLLLYAGLFMIIANLLLIVDDEVVQDVLVSKLRKFYAFVVNISSETVIYFAISVYFFTKNNYLGLLIAMVLMVMYFANKYFLSLAKNYKIKKMPEHFESFYRLLIIIVGLLMGPLGLVLAAAFSLGLSIWALTKKIQQIIAVIISHEKLQKVSKKKSKKSPSRK